MSSQWIYTENTGWAKTETFPQEADGVDDNNNDHLVALGYEKYPFMSNGDFSFYTLSFSVYRKLKGDINYEYIVDLDLGFEDSKTILIPEFPDLISFLGKLSPISTLIQLSRRIDEITEKINSIESKMKK